MCVQRMLKLYRRTLQPYRELLKRKILFYFFSFFEDNIGLSVSGSEDLIESGSNPDPDHDPKH